MTKNSRKRKQGGNPNLEKKPKNHSNSNDPADFQKLLDLCHKDQLINFLSDEALADSSLLAKIRSVADRDVSHRRVFIHGLSFEATRETLIETFSQFGAIKECNAPVDKATGRNKGYGFVVFKSRDSAARALEQPQKKIMNRVASCQLATAGVPPGVLPGPRPDTAGRKVHVGNVHAGASPDKLRAFFSQFGEIEAGPGFDMKTGKSRVYALIVYKTQEGANKALEQPYRMFEGQQLHVKIDSKPIKGKKKAIEQPYQMIEGHPEPNKGKGVIVPPAVPVLGPAPQPVLGHQPVFGVAPQHVLAAVAAAQNLALYSQNPAYAALFGQNPLLAAALNPLALNPAAMNPAMVNAAALNQMGGAGLGSYGGSPSIFGAYGSQGTGAFQGAQYGQHTLGRPGRPFGGMSS